MAQKRRSSSRRRRNSATTTKRRRRATRTVIVARTRRNGRRSAGRRRRNPFGVDTPGIGSIAGVLVGVSAAKLIPPMLPIGLGSPITRILTTGAVAFLSGMVAKRVAGNSVGNYVLLGGLAQTVSMGLNAFLPSVGGALGLSGMGYLTDSGPLVVPNNQLYTAPAAAVPAKNGVSGLDPFGRAF